MVCFRGTGSFVTNRKTPDFSLKKYHPEDQRLTGPNCHWNIRRRLCRLATSRRGNTLIWPHEIPLKPDRVKETPAQSLTFVPRVTLDLSYWASAEPWYLFNEFFLGWRWWWCVSAADPGSVFRTIRTRRRMELLNINHLTWKFRISSQVRFSTEDGDVWELPKNLTLARVVMSEYESQSLSNLLLLLTS